MSNINYSLEEEVKLTQIATEILAMGKADQEAQERNDGSIEKVITANTSRIKEIVTKHGYPIVSLVGKKASHWAWLVVQHSDHDVDFQTHCLGLMEEAANGEVQKSDIAYLKDRILKNRGQNQIYGTQFVLKNSKWAVWPVEDFDNLDIRRQEMGLNSFEEYKKDFFSDK